MKHTGTRAIGSSLDDIQRRLADDGFALLAGMCEIELITRLLEVSRERSRAVTQALGTQTIGIGSAAGFHEIVQRSPGRWDIPCLLYTSPSPRDRTRSRMPSSA